MTRLEVTFHDSLKWIETKFKPPKIKERINEPRNLIVDIHFPHLWLHSLTLLLLQLLTVLFFNVSLNEKKRSKKDKLRTRVNHSVKEKRSLSIQNYLLLYSNR